MKLYRTLTNTLLLLVLVYASACSDFLDVNEDPTSPNEVPEDLQLPSILGNFSYEVIGNEPARTPSQWIQQTAYNGVPPSEDNYDVTSSDVDNLWNASYIDVMNNVVELNTLAKENGNYAYSGIAKVIFAWNLSIITDLYGDIPLEEAFDPINTTPAYNSQEEVYTAIMDTLDAALDDFSQSSARSPGSDDLLYGGDMEKWEKLTYTLIARYHMRLSNAPGYDQQAQAQAALDALENGFTSNEDDADFQYYDESGSENPWYQFVIDGKWDTRNQLSAHYVDLLKSLDDPRLPIQARPAGAVDANGIVEDFDASDDPEYVGHENGEEGQGASQVSSIGSFYSAADAPLNWISYAEAKFIEAEVTLITSGVVAAQPIYEDAIAASMDKLGVEESEANDYISSLPLLAASGNALEEIITQKYIATFIQIEPYNDWRRTGYPEIEPVTNEVRTPSGIIPVRYPYPDSELQNNAENVSATGVPGGYPALEEHLWWDSE